MLSQPLTVLSRDSLPSSEDAIDPIELLNSEGAINIRNPVVVTEF